MLQILYMARCGRKWLGEFHCLDRQPCLDTTLPEWLCPYTIRLQVCRVFLLMQSPSSTMLLEATRNTIDPWRIYMTVFYSFTLTLNMSSQSALIIKHDKNAIINMILERCIKEPFYIFCVNSLNNISVDQLVWLPLHVIGHCRVMSRLCFSKSWVSLNLLLDAFCCCCSWMRAGHAKCSWCPSIIYWFMSLILTVFHVRWKFKQGYITSS